MRPGEYRTPESDFADAGKVGVDTRRPNAVMAAADQLGHILFVKLDCDWKVIGETALANTGLQVSESRLVGNGAVSSLWATKLHLRPSESHGGYCGASLSGTVKSRTLILA